MFDYTQTGDPGAVGAGKSWLNPTTGVAKIRNSANAAWTTWFSIDNPYGGLAPTSGFTATGAITGVSGWAPEADPDFDNSARLEGINLATQNDLTALRTEVYANVDARISRSIADYTSKVSVSDRIAVLSGSLNFTGSKAAQTIPLPTFASDGVVATESQCKWGAWPTVWAMFDDYTHGETEYWRFCVSESDTTVVQPSATRTFSFQQQGASGWVAGGWVNYMIIAVR